jgi:hypothetical protein
LGVEVGVWKEGFPRFETKSSEEVRESGEDNPEVKSSGEVPDNALDGSLVDRSRVGAASTDDTDGVGEV